MPKDLLKLVQQIKDAEGVSLASVIEKVKKVDGKTETNATDIKKTANALLKLKKEVESIPLTAEVKKLKDVIAAAEKRLKDQMAKEYKTLDDKISQTEKTLRQEIDDKIPDVVTVTEKISEVAKELDEEETEKVLEKVKSEDTVKSIRDTLESFEGDERLDASAIKNLPKFTQGGVAGGGSNLSVFKNGAFVSSSTRLNFTGSGVTVSNEGGRTKVDISGGGGGSTISVDSTEVTDPDFLSTGDIDFVATGSDVTANLNDDTVGLDELSATGTPSGSTFLRGDNTWATPAGSGDVSGPASSTDNAIPRFDGTTGTVIQNSGVTIDDSDNIAGANNLGLSGYLDLAEIAEPASAANTARLFAFDQNGETRLKFIDNDGVITDISQDNTFVVRNTSGAAMSKGDVVYVSSQTGQVPNVALAKSDSPTTLPAVSVLNEDIANNGYGTAMKVGIVEDIDTSAFSVGDELYVSADTAGEFTATRPPHPHLNQPVGKVLASGVGNGSIKVIIEFPKGDELGTRNNSFGVGDNTAGAKTIDFKNGSTGSLSWTPSAARTLTLPDATGTLALTSDLHDAVTVTDSAEIDFTLVGQDITASLVAGSIDETKLDASTNASLDLADSATQPNDLLTTLNLSTTSRIIGRTTAGAGVAEELTAAQVRTLINVEDGADVTDEANVTDALDGATLTAATVAGTDKVLIQDTDGADVLKTVTAQSIADLGGGGGNTYFNNIFIDQSGGTSDTHGVLAGTINGVNTTFTVSQSVYATGTLKVWLNGQLMTEGTSEDYTETTPGSGTFDFATAPVSGDEITVEYQTEVLSSDTVITNATTDVSTSAWVIDEDNMVSDLATKVPTQQSVKAYADLKAPIANPTFTGEIGIGAVNVSETELGILEGATVTTAELNTLDGITATTTELNYTDGVTSNIQTQLDDKLEAEDAVMGVIVHGGTAGTARPSGFDVVTWIGTVEPSNATNDDIWYDIS